MKDARLEMDRILSMQYVKSGDESVTKGIWAAIPSNTIEEMTYTRRESGTAIVGIISETNSLWWFSLRLLELAIHFFDQLQSRR